MPDDLLRYRDEFPILERTTYLISNSLGAMPRGVYDSLKGYADTWATRGVRAWAEKWWAVAAEVGADGVHVGQDDPPPAQVREVGDLLRCQHTMEIASGGYLKQPLRVAQDGRPKKITVREHGNAIAQRGC